MSRCPQFLAAFIVFFAQFCYGAYPQQFAGLTKCQLSSDPTSLSTTCENVQPPNISKPDVGVEQTSEFGAKYKRITIPSSGVDDAAVTQMFPIYSKVGAWNSDGTKLLLQAQNGFYHLFDGKTYEHIAKLDNSKNMYYSGTDPEVRWSHTNPDVFYYVYQMQFRSYDVSTYTTTTIRTFSDSDCGYSGTPSLAMIHNGDEGNSDDNDRYWVWYVQVGSPTYEQKRIIVYDRVTDLVLSTAGYESGGICGVDACPTSANWAGMSHSGNHVIVSWNLGASDGDFTTRGKGAEVFNRSLSYTVKASEKNWHDDLAQLADGTDVYVGQSHLNLTNGYKAIRAVSLDDGTIKKSCMLPLTRFQHISGRTSGSKIKGWILYSTYDQTGSQAGIISDGGTFALENFAVNMDTCEVIRIAHTQSNWSGSNYYSEPHATVNSDFTKIVWGSNWRDQAGTVQAYITECTAPRRLFRNLRPHTEVEP